jgi:hypothetical protein
VSTLSFVPSDGHGYVASRVAGTFKREGDSPANLMYVEDYPVTATCKAYAQLCLLEYKLPLEWQHVPAPAPTVRESIQ